MSHSSLRQRIKELGSAAAVASALITQPLVAQTSDVVRPLMQAALASVASSQRSEKKGAVPQLILQPADELTIEFTGHTSHSSHRSHSSHSSHSSHRSHYPSSAGGSLGG